MTKKPSEKNKAWEKDRRDRLNKTFDELSKLLPKYDASIVWSKIEIIQKAIAYITDLQRNHEEYLKAQDPRLFREYEDFVNCIKFYQERNTQLTEMLKKAKLTLPPVILPQLLVNKPELLPKATDSETVCLQRPKRQRISARRNDAIPKRPVEIEDVDVECKEVENIVSASMESVKMDHVNNPEKEFRSIEIPKNDEKEQDTDTKTHNAAFEEIPPQKNTEPRTPPPPSKPIYVRLKKRKIKRRLNAIRRPTVRKYYPHPDKILLWSSQDVAHQKITPNQKRLMKKKVCRKKELKRKTTSLPLREQSVSPTVAFLLSFPVVSSTAGTGKNVDNAESSVSLENLNNFFISEEYNQFCDQNTAPDGKLNVLNVGSLPLESEEKTSNNKPATSFSVSEITRPSSPKKRAVTCNDQTINKRNHESDWPENKFIRRTPVSSFDSSYDPKNTTCEFSYIHQRAPAQNSLVTAVSTECLPHPAHYSKLSAASLSGSTNLNLNQKVYSTQIHSVPSMNPSTILNPNIEKKHTDIVTSKVPNVTLHTATKQVPTTHNEIPAMNTVSWNAKPAVTNKRVFHNPGVSPAKNISHVSTVGVGTKTLPDMANETISKVSAKTSISPFYSPAKNFFYEFSSPNQPLSSFNFGRPAVAVSSAQSDPLFSSTITTKSQPFLTFPSIKPEFPWLQPSTTGSTTSHTTTTTSTPTTAAFNSNTIPFDLGSVVSESLTSTSFTLSLSTSKSYDTAIPDTGNKQIPEIKCINQTNLFPPCEELQFIPRVTSSLNKQANIQVNSTPKEISWKQEKTKDITDQIFYDCEQSKMQQKSHVNWMTSTVNDFSSAQAAAPLLPTDFVNQCPTTPAVDFGFGCRKESYDDDNQFINWSPTKPLNTDFSAAYTFENFGSNEAPPNKTVKQIFSVSQLVDQTPSHGSSLVKKANKTFTQKSTPIKQTFSNTYSAESLIAKKESHRMSNATSFYNQDTANTQTDYHNINNYIYSYTNSQGCLQPENDYLGAGSYTTSSTVKTTSILQPPASATAATAPAMPPFETSIVSSNNYFAHSNAVNTNDPYDPTYFLGNNYNHHAVANWNPCTTKGALGHSYNQSQIPLSVGYSTVESVCQQNSNASGNLTNFNLSSICPEIDGKDGSTGW